MLSQDQEARLRQTVDKTSFADPTTVRCNHVHLKLDVDFDAKVLRGHVDLTVERTREGSDPLKLDTRALSIHEVTDAATASSPAATALPWELEKPGVLGTSRLLVTLPESTAALGSKLTVRISYTTSSEATALQWLDANQTADKEMPYLFTQCQAIHASSMLPCQDTPSVKCPYTAELTVPTGMTCLMSATNPGGESQEQIDGGRSRFHFKQTIAIPSYLIAIAAGKLYGKKIGVRSNVWAEKSVVEKAAFEFSETEDFIQAAEKIVGPYQWGQYDLLVLPPSFPYGGMENPCLTFVTPTLLAGDRSLSSVVAHEISHSWTGNLVTNRTWEHFWLNEGFTRYLENRIVGSLYGEPRRHFAFIEGWKALQNSIDHFGASSPLTALIPPLDGIDPDDAFSSVPYEKGSSFLFYLETLVGGRDVFEPFLRAYVEKFQGITLTSGDFQDFFLSFFADKASQGVFDAVDWERWFFAPGMPPVKPDYDTSLVLVVEQLLEKIEKLMSSKAVLTESLSPADIGDFSSCQLVELLDRLLRHPPYTQDMVAQLDQVYVLSAAKHNTEVHFRWLRLGMRAGVESCFHGAKDFVTKQGRMKFVRPLYRDMFGNSSWLTEGHAHFQTHAMFYHPIARTMIGKDHQSAVAKVSATA
eukprot:scpid48813/ scgid23597/ Leukotriene A-4 hydrolase; Leukotriene A(4) hydrolase